MLTEEELYLMHHGIKGQKWGIRRFQNPDGSLTKEGKIRYANLSDSERLRYHIDNAKKVGSKVYAALKSTSHKAYSGAKIVGKKIGSSIVKSVKKRHPFLMSDEELKAAVDRAAQEKRYNDIVDEMKSRKFSAKVSAAIGNIAERSALEFSTSFAKSAGNQLAKSIIKSNKERQEERTSIIREREAERIARANEQQRMDETQNMDDAANLTQTRQNIRDAERRRDSLSPDDVRRLAYDRAIRNMQNRERDIEQRLSDRSERIEARRRQMESQGYSVYGNNQGGNQNQQQNKKKKKKKRPPED